LTAPPQDIYPHAIMTMIFCLTTGLVVSSILLAHPAIAQLQPDQTLGAESSAVNPGSIQGIPSQVIQGGARRGGNLFHSFLNFNVAEGQRVYFGNPDGVSNILTRVTGNTPSAILGTLGVNGGANLFLLNPNGIQFGANSRLDIRGSFIATTASSFTFPDGSEFSAVQPAAPPLLTMSVTPGLQYGKVPANVTNAGRLEVGGNLTLAGGNVITTGQLTAGGDLTLAAQDTVQIRDSVTTPFIAQAGGQLLVQGNQSVDIFALSHPDSGLFSGGDMVLRSPNPVMGDAHYWTGGNFRIEQLNQQPGKLISPADPIIRATGDITLNGYIGASLHILAGGKVTINGGVQITGPGAVTDSLRETITLSDGTTLKIDGSAVPTLDIRAGLLNVGTGVTNTSGFFINPPPAISLTPANLTQPATGSNIVIGDIDVTVPNGVVFLTNNYAPNPTLPGGDITVQGTDFFATGRIGIRTDSTTGNGGSVTIDARNQLALNAPVNTGNTNTGINTGNSGSVKLLANNGITINDLIDSRSVLGNAGNVTISTPGQAIVNAPIATASTLGNGGTVTITGNNGIATNSIIDTRSGLSNGGNVVLSSESQVFSNGTILTQSSLGNSGSVVLYGQNGITSNAEINTEATGFGKAGNITLLAPTGTLTVNKKITSDTLGSGAAGTIDLTARDILIQNGANLSVNTFGSGTGGTITANANQLTLQANSQLAALTGNDLRNASNVTPNSGQGGSIRLDIADSINLFNQSVITTQTNQLSSGTAGDLNIRTSNLTLQGGSYLAATSQGSGKGGDITLDIANSLTLQGTATANTQTGIYLNSFSSGDAGNLTIQNPQTISILDGALIAASASSTGRAGNLTVNAPNALMQIIGASAAGTNASSILSETSGGGDGGDIRIGVRQLVLQNGGQISGQTIGAGNAGTLNISASDSIQVWGQTGKFASRLAFDSSNSGNAGALTIQTPILRIAEGGRVSGRTSASGQGGVIAVTTPNTLELDRGGLFFDSSGTGNPRGIVVNAGDVSIRNGGQLTVSSTESANAGNLVMRAQELFMSDGARLTATTASGEGGNIEVRVDESITLRRDSDIRTQALGSGNGGNITLEAGKFILAFLSEDSDVIAGAVTGRGGNIFGKAQAIVGFRLFDRVETPESDFVASSLLGLDGIITLDTRNPQTPPNLANLLDRPAIALGCGASPGVGAMPAGGGQLVNAGQGGMVPDPSSSLSSSALWQDRSSAETADAEVPASAPGGLDIAQGWVEGPNGTVVLTSRPTTAAASQSFLFPVPGCSTP